MKTAVGIDFTDYTVQNLRQRGFINMQVETFESHHSYIFPLACDDPRFAGFEIHVVREEADYLSRTRQKHFFPYIRHDAPAAEPLQQANGANTLGPVLSYDTLGDSPLGHYLSIRKGFEIPALLLRCQDLEAFAAIAKPDLEFKLKESANTQVRPAKVIQLGPSCFDLIVVQS